MRNRILFFISILLFLFFGLGARIYPVHAATFTWNTFLGGSGSDNGNDITIDSSGGMYIMGSSTVTWGSPVRAYTEGADAFVAKLDSSGNLLWNTFLGGSGTDSGYRISLDSSNNIYITGYSSVTWGTPVRAYTAPDDAFVAKLDSSGNLLWNTFLGGSVWDYGRDLTLDSSSNIYVTGRSNATWGSPVRAYTAGYDIFVAKLDSSSGSLLWNTFLGGNGADRGYGITLDASSNIYVTGDSNATWGSPVRAYISGYDAIAVKIDSSGNLIWNTFFGGSGTDQGSKMIRDSSYNIYVIGYSNATWGSPIRAYKAGYDAIAVKIDSSGNLVWNTFLGGDGTDYGNGITLDSSNNIYVIGYSGATWGSPIRAYTASLDTVIAMLSTNGEVGWNTFLGGSGDDYGNGIFFDSSKNIFITGYSSATWGAPIRPYTANNDAFVAQVAYDPPGVDIPVPGKPDPSSPACSDQPPVGAPNLFRVDMKDTYAILYYSPFSGGNTNYYISYSEEPTSFHHGVFTGQTTATGVLSFTIRDLKPNTTYYFRLRGQNGCMPGVWGNERKGTTKQFFSSDERYSPIPPITPIPPISPSNTPTPTPAVLGTTSAKSHPPTQSVSPTPLAKSRFQPLKPFPTHFCFLWWCW